MVSPCGELRSWPFDGVRLQERVQLALVAPVALEVVEVQLAGVGVADDRIPPLGQLHGQAGGGAGEQSVGALDGLRQAQTLARGTHGSRVTDLCDDA